MILTLLNAKGGVGKTTCCIHLACYFQLHHGDTCILDGDRNRSATKYASSGNLPIAVIDAEKADQASKYKNWLIDTQASESASELAPLVESCDLFILPTTPDAMALYGLLGTVEMLQSLGAVNYIALLNRVPTNPRITDDAEMRETLAEMNLPVFDSSIREFRAYQKSALAGVPVYELKGDRNSKIAWSDFTRLGEEIQYV
jgi:chromosome partitioning protein